MFNKYNKIFYLMFLILMLCIPINIKGAHITKKGTVYSANGFVCDTTKTTIGKVPCITNVYISDSLYSGYYSSSLKYTNMGNNKKIVFCVEHGKQNPDYGAQCLLKYQNYSHYVLAGLGQIIKNSGGDTLNMNNVYARGSNYVNIALAQNNYLQTLMYYQDSANAKANTSNSDIKGYTKAGLDAALNYYYYTKNSSEPATISSTIDSNRNLSIKLNKKDLSIARYNKLVVKGEISYDSCSYRLINGDTNETLVASHDCGTNSNIGTYTVPTGVAKVQVQVTLLKTFYLAALYDCVGQDVTLANTYPITKTLTISKTININDNKKLKITKKDSAGKLLKGVKFTASTNMTQDNNLGSTFNCTTNQNGECTILLPADVSRIYLFEAYKTNGCSSKSVSENGTNNVYYTTNPTNYDLENPTYTVNGAEVAVNSNNYISAYYYKGGCYDTTTIKDLNYIKKIPYISFEANDNTEIVVENRLLAQGCQERLNNIMSSGGSHELQLINLYIEYKDKGDDFRQLLNFSSPQCMPINEIEKKTRTSCLRATSTYSNDFLDESKEIEQDTTNSVDRSFNAFNSKNLSTYENIKPLNSEAGSAFCKSVYEILPVSKTEDLKPAYGGQLYFKLDDSKIMSGEYVEICYFIGNDNSSVKSEDNNFQSATLDNGKNKIILNVDTKKTEVKTTENNFRKVVYVTKISYNLPEIFVGLDGKKNLTMEKCIKNGITCKSLGYGILSPISTNRDLNRKNIIEKDLNFNINSNDWEQDSNNLDSEDEFLLENSDENFELANENSDAPNITQSTVINNDNNINNNDNYINSNLNSDNYYFSADAIKKDIYIFKLGSESAECEYNYIPQIRCNDELCLEFRIIDTENPFVDKNGSNRNTMTNWCNKTDCSYNNNLVKAHIINAPNSYGRMNTVENINSKVAPKYKIILNHETIEEIKNFASSNNITYGNSNFSCEKGVCTSRLVKDLLTKQMLQKATN